MLGFSFNKERTRALAERYVQQNKLSNAISEYEKIIKHDPRDLTVLNTIGDLCVRLGQSDKAIKHFRQVGDAYAKDGFTVKAIAVYKKIVKLEPGMLECLERLGDLYGEQKMPNEARAQYAAAADGYVRDGNAKEGVRILRRVVEIEPENVATLSRLADLLVTTQNPMEAHELLSKAAGTLFQRRAFDQAGQVLARVLQLDPNDMRALELRGRVLLEMDDAPGAIASFQRVADIDAHPDAVRALLRAYIFCDRMSDAKTLATKLLETGHDADGIFLLVNRLFSEEKNLDALLMLDEFAEPLFAADTKKIVEYLHDCLPHVRNDSEALGLVQKLFQRAGDMSQMGEVLELRAHACASQGDLTTARELYYDLAQMEPDNPTHIQAYRQLSARIGERSPRDQVSGMEETSITDFGEKLAEEETTLKQEYPPQIEEMVRLALTEAELCESLGAPANALPTLEAALARVPEDVRLNRTLASIYARSREPDSARRCYATLYRVYQQADRPNEALRFAKLAGIDAQPSKETPRLEPAIPSYMFEEPETQGAGTVEEVDLSSEWQEASQQVQDSETAPGILRDLDEEIRFYLANGMLQDAKQSIEKMARLAPDAPMLTQLRQDLEKAAAAAGGQGMDLVVEDVEEEPAPPPPLVIAKAPSPPPPTPTAPPPSAARAAAEAKGLGGFAADLEASLGGDFDFGTPAAAPPKPPPPAFERTPAPAPVVEQAPAPVVDRTPAPRVAAPVKPALPPPKPAAAPVEPAAPATTKGMFSDLVSEMSNDLGDSGASGDDDPETHYSLGIAFREMGLMDEAIGEMQKVCKYIDDGHSFPHALLAYTWLAECLVGEGLPEAAFQWYERALKLAPDADSRNAIHYDLASAYESAGRKQEALQHFLEVMSSNIDYRDTANRVRGLRSTAV